ncbi:MAG: hypothetical protein ACRD15_13150 [Vicinamibacterales bacterium]
MRSAERLWSADRPLTATGILMLGWLTASLAGLAIDSRVITGAPAWQTFEDRALGWALRLGLSITIIGASSGGLMTQPTAAQLDEARTTHRMSVAGAHTVGAPDGGPGMTGTGWSLEHGDLRIPHFIGLHALQVLPLLALASRRGRWSEITRVRLSFIAAASYVLLFAILLGQALRGHALVQPDAATVAALTAWAAVTAIAGWLAAARSDSGAAHFVR